MTANNPQIRHFVVAITGASGSVYGLRLISELLRSGERVSLILTSAGRQVMNHETGLEWSAEIKLQRQQVQEYFASIAVDCLAIDDFWAGAASGSAKLGAATAGSACSCSSGWIRKRY